MHEKISKKQTRQQREWRTRMLKTSAVAIIVLLFAAELIFFGNTAYAIKWLQCGQRPAVEVANTKLFAFGQPQEVTILSHPGFFDEKWSILNNNPAQHHLFCTVDEARQAADKITIPSAIKNE